MVYIHLPPPPPPSEVPKTDALMQIKSKFEPIAAKRFLQAWYFFIRL